MTFPEWPKWMYRPDGSGEIFERPEDVPSGFLTLDQLTALDHDGNGAMGGSKPRRRKAAK